MSVFGGFLYSRQPPTPGTIAYRARKAPPEGVGLPASRREISIYVTALTYLARCPE
jgi:hypothetical protein